MSLRTALAFFFFPAVFAVGLPSSLLPAQAQAPAVLGYADFSTEAKIEEKFLAVPDPKLAGEELKTLTAEPHLAATPEDHKTAEYVAQKFRAAGLETTIVPYRVLMNRPGVVRVEAYDPAGHLLMTGPAREHVERHRKRGTKRHRAGCHVDPTAERAMADEDEQQAADKRRQQGDFKQCHDRSPDGGLPTAS